jgi:hypothetical protein
LPASTVVEKGSRDGHTDDAGQERVTVDVAAVSVFALGRG